MIPNFYNIYEWEDGLIISPNDRKLFIKIDRVTHAIKIEIPIHVSPTIVHAIIGVTRLISGLFLLVADEVEKCGELWGHEVFRIVHTRMIRIAKSLEHMSASQQAEENYYRKMYESVINTPGFYFSYTYDLTLSLQRITDSVAEFKNQSLYERANEAYVWNGDLLKEWLTRLKMADQSYRNWQDFCLPVMHGFVEILSDLTTSSQSIDSKNSDSVYALISRRSVHRAGTRFYVRGVDKEGHAANTVETEQIVAIPGHQFSFVQLRGSIPLFWDQLPSLRYTPSISIRGSIVSNESAERAEEVITTEEQRMICQKHFDQHVFINNFGRNVCVNLVSQKGRERPLGRSFAALVNTLSQDEVKYEAFDFHAECGETRWDRLDLLLDRLAPELERMSLFHMLVSGQASSSAIVSRQNGVFRTNCIDCLDRTNVVQSMLALRVLNRTLVQSGVLASPLSSLPSRESYSHLNLESFWPGFSSRFKNLWADHADMLSVQYSGTPALKTDFTRTGRRTYLGMLNDGFHSLQRYYLNNFRDGYRQDSLNLFLGHYKIYNEEGWLKPLPEDPRNGHMHLGLQLLPPALFFTFFMCGITLAASEPSFQSAMHALMWMTAFSVSLFVTVQHGAYFVDIPKFRFYGTQP